MPKTHEVKEGESLSAIAPQFGLPWKDIFEANRGIIGGNPNLIKPGQVLTIPEKKEEAPEAEIIDETEGKEAIEKFGLGEEEALPKAKPVLLYNEQGQSRSFSEGDFEAAKTQGYTYLAQPKAKEGETGDKTTLSKEEKEALGIAGEEELDEPTKQALQSGAQSLINIQTKISDSISALDKAREARESAVNTLIESIKSNYADKIKQAQESNQRYVASLKKWGHISGITRYGDIENVISPAEAYGLDQITELQNKRDLLIAEAKSDLEGKKYDQLADKIDDLEKNRDDKLEVLQKMYKDSWEQNKKISETNSKAGIDESVANLISLGITDPGQILKSVAGATIEDVEKSLRTFAINKDTTSGANLTADLKTFEYLQENGMLPEEITSLDKSKQYFAYMNYLKEGNVEGKKATALSGVKIGVGANDLAEETVVRARLTSKLMNILNKGQLSDSDRAIINENITILRDAGYSEQEIMDKLSGFATDVITPYNERFRNLIVANTKDNASQTDQMSKVSLLLNNGDYLQAMKTTENLAMINAKQTDPDNYLGTATADNYLTIVKSIKDKLETAGVIGFIEGNFQKILGKLKGKEATQIRSDLTRLYSQFRRETAGTAVTENELKFLDPLFADINDRKGNFLTKLDSFERNVKDRYNATRSSVGLPEVNTGEVLDENKRLQLYELSLPSESVAKDKVLEYGTENPGDRELINTLLNEKDSELGRVLSYDEIYQYLKQLGKIQ